MAQEALGWLFILVVMLLFVGVAAILFKVVRGIIEEFGDNEDTIPYGWRWNKERRRDA